MTAYLVCYDISDDRARQRVATALGAWGERLQRSVFQVEIASASDLAQLRGELDTIAGPDADVRLLALCSRCRSASHTLSGAPAATPPGSRIV